VMNLMECLKIYRKHSIMANGSGLCVVALSRNLKLTTTLDRAITQNPCYVPLNLEAQCSK
jgi:hypothetical protein